MIIRNPIDKTVLHIVLEVGQKIRQSDTFVFDWEQRVEGEMMIYMSGSEHMPSAAPQQHQACPGWQSDQRSHLTSHLIPHPLLLLDTPGRKSFFMIWLRLCYWYCPVSRQCECADHRVSRWWPVQSAVQCAVYSPDRRLATTATANTQSVERREEGEGGQSSGQQNTKIYPVWYLPPLSTQCQILTTSRQAGAGVSTHHLSLSLSLSLSSPQSQFQDMKRLNKFYAFTWQFACGQARQCPVIRLSPIRSSKMMTTDFQISKLEKYPVTRMC